MAAKDDQPTTVGEKPGGATGFDGVGECGAVGAEEFCPYHGGKWRPEGKCPDQLPFRRLERLDRVTKPLGETTMRPKGSWLVGTAGVVAVEAAGLE
jgi:hypothetical protein